MGRCYGTLSRGLGYAITRTAQGAVCFAITPLVLTDLVGWFFGWLAARCGFVRPSVLCHSLINAPGPIIAVLLGPTYTG